MQVYARGLTVQEWGEAFAENMAALVVVYLPRHEVKLNFAILYASIERQACRCMTALTCSSTQFESLGQVMRRDLCTAYK